MFLLFEQGGDGLFRTRHGRKTLVEAYLVPAAAHMRSPRSTSLGSSGLLKNSISGSSTIRPSETLRDKKEHGAEAAGRQLSSSLTCRAFVRALRGLNCFEFKKFRYLVSSRDKRNFIHRPLRPTSRAWARHVRCQENSQQLSRFLIWQRRGGQKGLQEESEFR